MNSLTLAQVELNFAQWRGEKKYKGEAIPDSLKLQVNSIIGNYKRTEILHRLKLNSSQIRGMLKDDPAAKKSSNSPAFFELGSAVVIKPQVELCFPGGLTVKISS